MHIEKYNNTKSTQGILSSYNLLQLAHSLKIHQHTNSTKLNSIISYSPSGNKTINVCGGLFWIFFFFFLMVIVSDCFFFYLVSHSSFF